MDNVDHMVIKGNSKQIRVSGAQLNTNNILAGPSNLIRASLPNLQPMSKGIGFVRASSLPSATAAIKKSKVDSFVSPNDETSSDSLPASFVTHSKRKRKMEPGCVTIDTFFNKIPKVKQEAAVIVNTPVLIKQESPQTSKDVVYVDLTDCTDETSDDMFLFAIASNMEQEELKYKLDPFNLKSDEDFTSSNLMSINNLPNEIILKILETLPPPDLEACVLVCKRWHQLIHLPISMRWKKCYFRLRQGDKPTLSNMVSLLEYKNDNVDRMFSNIIRLFATFKPTEREYVFDIVRRHTLYPAIVRLMQERFLDCLETKTKPKPWCAFAALCLLSADLHSLWFLLGPSIGGSRDVIVEGIYFLASCLLALTSTDKDYAWNRLHYHLAYLIHHLEKDGTVQLGCLKDKLMCGDTGQQSILRYGNDASKMRLTHEQLRIARHDLNTGDIVKIKAFAGTGKTTTLVNFAIFKPNIKFLLIVYNKSMQLHAAKMFPKNVECRTGHSLAYGAIGRQYQHKLGNLNSRVLTDVLPERPGEHAGNFFTRCRLVTETIDNFVASTHDQISLVHIPGNTRREEDGGHVPITCSVRDAVLEDSEMVWERMKSLDDRGVCMTHDGYLKLWQLSRPSLTKWGAVLVDEAQDTTPPLLDVITRQSHLAKVFVGDPNQQIYSFRGAVNAMDLIPHTHQYSLTESFRFGIDIALIGNTVLQTLKQEKDYLIGKNSRSTIDGELNELGPRTIICRCNMTIVHMSLAECCTKKSQKFIYFIGGVTGVGFPALRDLYQLSLPIESRTAPIKDSFLKKYQYPNGFHKLRMYAIHADDQELNSRIQFVQLHGSRLLGYLDEIENWVARNQEQAHIVYTTAHKSKGLEFNQVVLSDDFDDSKSEEVNLLYVAATRAKVNLTLEHNLARLLFTRGSISPCLPVPATLAKSTDNILEQWTGEKLLRYPYQKVVQPPDVWIEDELVNEEEHPFDFECEIEFEPYTFVLCTPEIAFSGSFDHNSKKLRGCSVPGYRHHHPEKLSLGERCWLGLVGDPISSSLL